MNDKQKLAKQIKKWRKEAIAKCVENFHFQTEKERERFIDECLAKKILEMMGKPKCQHKWDKMKKVFFSGGDFMYRQRCKKCGKIRRI